VRATPGFLGGLQLKSARRKVFQLAPDVHGKANGMHIPLVWHSVTAQSIRVTLLKDARGSHPVRYLSQVDVNGELVPGSVSRDRCLHCAFKSRCQSGTGASIRASVPVMWPGSPSICISPKIWLTLLGYTFREHQTCIGLHSTTCS
jgi:hypothetical protein